MRARSERGAASASTTASVAAALAVLAVLAVLGSATAAGVGYRAETQEESRSSPSPSAPVSPEEPEETEDSEFPDGQVLAGDSRDNALVDFPSVDERWVRFSGILGFEDSAGEERAVITDPLTFDDGYCTSPDGAEQSRAFGGFTAPIEATTGDDRARDAVEQTVERWLGVVLDDEADRPDVEYTATETSDGVPAVLARTRYEITENRDRCDPPSNELSFLAFETGEFVAVVVMVRGVDDDGSDRPDGLDAETRDRILGSARKQN